MAFVIYTGRWNAADRGMEQEILDMCAAEDMAVAPGRTWRWHVQNTGARRSQAEEARGNVYPKKLAASQAMAAVLNRIAERRSTLPTSVAMAWVMQKQPYVFPLIVGRKIEHLKANIEALSLKLEDADIKEIEDASDFERGFRMMS